MPLKVVFTRGTTNSLNMIAQSLEMKLLMKVIITSELEHHSSLTLMRVAKRKMLN